MNLVPVVFSNKLKCAEMVYIIECVKYKLYFHLNFFLVNLFLFTFPADIKIYLALACHIYFQTFPHLPGTNWSNQYKSNIWVISFVNLLLFNFPSNLPSTCPGLFPTISKSYGSFISNQHKTTCYRKEVFVISITAAVLINLIIQRRMFYLIHHTPTHVSCVVYLCTIDSSSCQ